MLLVPPTAAAVVRTLSSFVFFYVLRMILGNFHILLLLVVPTTGVLCRGWMTSLLRSRQGSKVPDRLIGGRPWLCYFVPRLLRLYLEVLFALRCACLIFPLVIYSCFTLCAVYVNSGAVALARFSLSLCHIYLLRGDTTDRFKFVFHFSCFFFALIILLRSFSVFPLLFYLFRI